MISVEYTNWFQWITSADFSEVYQLISVKYISWFQWSIPIDFSEVFQLISVRFTSWIQWSISAHFSEIYQLILEKFISWFQWSLSTDFSEVHQHSVKRKFCPPNRLHMSAFMSKELLVKWSAVITFSMVLFRWAWPVPSTRFGMFVIFWQVFPVH